MDETEEDFTVRELYYLIVKFLENGPCAASVTALRREIEENKLVIPRKDWLGNEHARSLLDFEQLNNHIPNHYLTGIAHEFNALTDRASSSNVKSVKSLLTCSKLSILRDAKSKTYDKFCYASSHVSSQNGAPYIIPSIINKVPINSVLIGRNNHGARGVANIRNHCGIYSKFCLHKQILGHLASVYCVLFDQTGNIVITGADDNLLKMWSARDGRLISTFRGHAAQITDISINYENTFIASGSLDKTVRVWSLKDTQPVAVLQGHTGMVTSLRFCPNADKTVRYLVSTGGDGHICFWSWSPNTREFNLTPTRYNEKTRPGAQMLCSSFSPGGTFLVTGSSDNYIRVYQVYPDGPEKIVELPNHADHVDSILYSTLGDSFLSGSRDGTAIIWSFRKGEWHAKCLDNSKRLSDDPKLNAEPETNDKLKVTMICWSCNDYYITTASTDYSIRVWNASQATLMHAMRGHTDELFLLEAHPTDPRILLSGGHDGNIIIWDIAKNVKIKSFFNRLEGQGHGAIFDAKFSPRGDQFVATDSHGHLMIYGFGSDTRYQAVPYEQFFHTDYHPIIRDANNYVLDEQTQMAPHLMPPPFLVDVDGNPHTANYQMLIPGRTSSNLPRIRIEERPQIEGLPPLIAEMQAAEAEQRNLLSPGVRSRANSFYSDGGLLSPGGGARESGVGLRESGDVEGVRLQNNLYVSGDISEADAEQWRNRRLIPNNTLYNEVEEELKRLQTGLEELQKYLKEKKNTTIVLENELSMSETTKRFLRSNSVRSRGRGRGRGRMHKVRQPVTYVRDSAMQSPQQTIRTSSGREVVVIDDPSTVTMSESEPEDWQGESSDSSDSSDFEWSHPSAAKKEKERRRQKRKHRSSDDGEEETEDEEVDVTGSDSEKKSNRRRGRRRRNRRESDQSSKDSEKSDSSSEGSNESSSNEESEVEKKPTIIEISSTIQSNCNESSPKMKLRNSPRKTRRRRKRKRIAMPTKKEKPREIKERKPFKKKEKKEIKSRNPPPPIENLEEYLHYYQPPEWLLRSDTRKFPYVPQIGDEVYYLRQGHHLYVQEVITQNEYDIQEGRQAYRRYDLDPAELCKLVGLAYDVGPPKMCSLKLELISKKKSTGAKKTITIRFHDMPNVVDFLVLKHIYDKSLEQNWKEGDRFRCIIDELWYYGTIQAVSPFNDEFPTSSFLCLGVKWDSGEEERLSPWDLEKVPGDQDEAVVVGTSVQEEEVDLYKYQPTEQDWPFESLDEMTERIAQGLEEFSSLDFVAPFAFPVDVKLYPSYWSCIAFPTDLETIRTKINKRFYRRIDALLWEIRQLRTNASKFNEQGSGIVLDAAYIVKLLTKFIRDPAQRNILDLNDELTEIEASKITYDEHDSEEEEEMEEFEQLQDAAEVAGGSSSGSSSNSAKTWVVEAKSLLEFICSKDDAHPFREPVDPDMFEGYSDVIREPMDLSTIRHRLESNQYDNAEAYIRDFQLMFKNSKTYNTDRRSLIYKMTLRLSALFETRCDVVRRAYAMDNDMNPHWTRGKSKQLVRIQLHGIYGDSSKNPISINSNFPKIKKEETVSNSPRKPKFITLNQFVKRPQTRSSRNEVENRSSSPEVLIKKSKYEMNGYSNSEDEDEETKPGLNDIKRTRPNRKTVKRKMYGFEESDDENVAETKRSKRKLLPRVKISRLKSKTESVGHTTRSSRNKTTVNYCDDYYDEFSEDEVDNENLIEVKRERDSTDNSNASEESENEKPIVTISSRGRMRKASRKFPFF